MKKNDLISVIVPVYNVEKYLKRCLESLVNQTYQNIEIIVINDGSLDKSQQIIDNFSKKHSCIRPFENANMGIANTRNFGIDHAKGKYILFIDSDDYVEKDYCEYLYNLIIKYKCDIACCDYCLNDEIEKIEEEIKIFSSKNTLHSFLNYPLIKTPVWNKMYSKSIINEIRFKNFKMAEDLLFNTEVLMKVNKVICSNLKKYHYNTLNTSITRSKINIQKVKDCCEAHDLQFSILKNQSEDLLCKVLINKFNALYMFYLQIDNETSKEVKKYIKKEITNLKKVYKNYMHNRSYSKKIMLKINLIIIFFNLYYRFYKIKRLI